MSQKTLFQLQISFIMIAVMLFGGLHVSQVNVGSQIIIENKANITISNDPDGTNNEAIVRDILIPASSSSSSSYDYVGFDADALSFIKQKAILNQNNHSLPVEQKIVIFGYQINITNNNYNSNINNNSAQANADNNNSVNSSVTVEAKSDYSIAPIIVINNPVELASFVAGNPVQAVALAANMVRTGGGYNLVILPLLLILLIVAIRSFYSKKFQTKIQ